MDKKEERTEEEKPSVGRPSGYKPEYCQRLLDFFSLEVFFEKEKTIPTKDGPIVITTDEASEIPMFQDFCKEVGVHRDTLHEWRDKHPEFSDAYKKAKDLQEMIIAKNAIKGRYDKTFSIFMLKCNHGWNDGNNQQTGNVKMEIDNDESQL